MNSLTKDLIGKLKSNSLAWKAFDKFYSIESPRETLVAFENLPFLGQVGYFIKFLEHYDMGLDTGIYDCQEVIESYNKAIRQGFEILNKQLSGEVING